MRQGIFLPKSTFSADSLTVSIFPPPPPPPPPTCMQLYALTSVCTPCQSSVGNTKIPSMHLKLGSVTLSQLAFLRESNLYFPWGKSQLDDTVVKKNFNWPTLLWFQTSEGSFTHTTRSVQFQHAYHVYNTRWGARSDLSMTR